MCGVVNGTTSKSACQTDAAIALAQVNLSLGQGAARVHILKDINLNIGGGEAIGLVGPSGSGKSTLLMVIAGLERAQSRVDRLEVQPAPAPGGEQIADAAPEVAFGQLGGADIRIAAVGAQEPIERITGGVAGVIGALLANAFTAAVLKGLFDARYRFEWLPSTAAVAATASRYSNASERRSRSRSRSGSTAGESIDTGTLYFSALIPMS